MTLLRRSQAVVRNEKNRQFVPLEAPEREADPDSMTGASDEARRRYEQVVERMSKRR
jgi:hypothetical protein